MKDDVNPNIYGMIETIVCSRAKLFAGTFWSTFTGMVCLLCTATNYLSSTYQHTYVHTYIQYNTCTYFIQASYLPTYRIHPGYIHRLRGYHGLGNATYYHFRPHTFDLQKTEKNEYGWWREWKAGWTEDDGRLI